MISLFMWMFGVLAVSFAWMFIPSTYLRPSVLLDQNISADITSFDNRGATAVAANLLNVHQAAIAYHAVFPGFTGVIAPASLTLQGGVSTNYLTTAVLAGGHVCTWQSTVPDNAPGIMVAEEMELIMSGYGNGYGYAGSWLAGYAYNGVYQTAANQLGSSVAVIAIPCVGTGIYVPTDTVYRAVRYTP